MTFSFYFGNVFTKFYLFIKQILKIDINIYIFEMVPTDWQLLKNYNLGH